MKADTIRRIVVLGLSLSSSWGNGHATTYRALLKALAERGHQILFLERDRRWYAAHRDVKRPRYCTLAFYKRLGELARWRGEIAAADLVIVGSYVTDGVAVARFVQEHATGITAFYDIDTPVTLAKLREGDHEYLAPSLIPQFDLYLSFTGGPTLDVLESRYGAARARPLYCSVDPTLYRPTKARRRWDIGYLGTYSRDRQPKLEKLLFEPARRLSHRRFVVAGAQYPKDIAWPANVDHIDHLPPSRHARFYSSIGWALNLTRDDMGRWATAQACGFSKRPLAPRRSSRISGTASIRCCGRTKRWRLRRLPKRCFSCSPCRRKSAPPWVAPRAGGSSRPIPRRTAPRRSTRISITSRIVGRSRLDLR